MDPIPYDGIQIRGYINEEGRLNPLPGCIKNKREKKEIQDRVIKNCPHFIFSNISQAFSQIPTGTVDSKGNISLLCIVLLHTPYFGSFSFHKPDLYS